MASIFNRYLKILDVTRKKPSIEYLRELLTSHIVRIPFENISKLYYYYTKDLNTIPDFNLYLTGIEQNKFGGTCYSNNHYFNQLLLHLGFEAWLCGADMSEPDVHLVNVVIFGNMKYLTDVGYGAPFFIPIPLDSNDNYNISFGNDNYVVLPKNNKGYSELKQYRENKLKHGYVVKPNERSISEFEGVIKDSFRKSSTFLNRITAIKYGLTYSISIRNFSLIEIQNEHLRKTQLNSKDQIIEQINNYFHIPKNILQESISPLNNL
jgi:arylamine N-acetyltransferase